jgi:hypothetical protein
LLVVAEASPPLIFFFLLFYLFSSGAVRVSLASLQQPGVSAQLIRGVADFLLQ